MQRTKKEIFFLIISIYTICIFLIWNKEHSTQFSIEELQPQSVQEIQMKLVDQSTTMVEMTTKDDHHISRVVESSPKNVYDSNHIWRVVESSPNNVFYYAAFSNKNNALRLFGAIKRGLKENMQCCYFRNITASSNFSITGTNYGVLPEGKGLRYSAAFFTCPLPKSTRPYAVSLSTDQCKTPSNILPIVYPQKQTRKFTVCVSPLNFRYSRAYELVEMIELNRLLGADHFVFYNYSTAHNVDKVLEYYKKQGLVEVLEWNLPMKVDTWPKTNEPVEIHYFAQLAALNDCLYRNMFLSKYIVFQDMDEFIIPQKQVTWSEMMEKLPTGYGAYIFRCVFFRKEWPDIEMDFPGKSTAIKYKMNTLLKQKRERKILGRTHRSKYIVDPRQIDTVGIHNIWRFRPGAKSHFVDSEFARLHHYRNWLNPNDAQSGIIDQKTMTYKDQLLKNTIKTWESLRNVPLGSLDGA